MIYKNSTLKQRQFSLFAFLIVLIFTPVIGTAATRTWDGGGATNNFSEAANWSNDTAPTSADDGVFDGTSQKNVTVDQALTINSLSINGGYGGTITQTAILTVTNAFTQSAGFFQGTAADANFGTLILNAGATFNAPSGTLSLTSPSAYYIFDFNGGTFNANGGTLNANARPDTNYFRGLALTLNNLTFSKPVAIFNSLTVNGDLIIGAAADLQSSFIQANGNVTFADGANSVTGGSTEIRFNDAATRTATISGTTISLPIVVNNPNITVTTAATSGTVVWNKKVTLQAGTLQQTAANYTFSASAGFNNPGFNIIGGTFQGSAGSANFNTTIGLSAGNLNGGSGSLGTNVVSCPPGFPIPSYYFQQSGGSFNGGSGDARFCDVRRTGGTFTAPSGNLTILQYGDFAGGTFSANNGTLIVENNVSINAPGFALNNVTLLGANGHGFSGTPKPQINGTFNLAEGQFSSGDVAANGDVIYGANFTGGGGRLFLEGTATRTINLPARNILLGMTLDNPNVTVTTSGAGASTFVGLVDVKRGLFQQGNQVLNFGGNGLTVSGGTFQGSSADLNPAGIIVSGGNFNGGSGLITTGTIETTGGVFSSVGDVNLSTYRQSGGTFNAPSGLMTVVADWTHTAGGTFNAGTGTVKFTGYQTFNCINQIALDVPTSETFYNLNLANSFCNVRYLGAGDLLIVNGDFRISYGGFGGFGGSRIRPLGTTTIDATNSSLGGVTVEYVTPNRNFVINNPSSTVSMFPVEMNAANSTLTSSSAGRINFSAMNLLDGTVNQGAGVWDISAFPGYSQSGGAFNGSAAELFVANGTGNPLLTGGVFNGGAGKVTGSFRMTGGTMTIAGDMDTSIFTLEGGIFNAPNGTMRFTGGNGNCFFSHTAAGGTFNPRSGTVEIQFGGCGFDVNQRETFNNLIFRGGNFIAANDTLVVGGITTFNGGGSNGGSIEANGDVQHLNGGTGNTNGNPNNGTTVLKFVDTATRIINFNTSNQTYATLAVLVDNPNITVNFETTADTQAIINSLTLQRGTINQGAGRAGILNNFAQSGGVYNAGAFAGVFSLPTTGFGGDFSLSGGDFNAGNHTQFSGSYTHTAGGTFNYGAGTVVFGGIGGTIDVNATENFNNIRFQQGSTATTKTIAAGDTIVANGTLEFLSGYVSGGTLEAKANVSIGAGNQFSGGSTALNFTGAADQTFTNSGGITTSGVWTVNKPNSAPRQENADAPTAFSSLLISGNVGNNGSATLVPLNIVSGGVRLTGAFDLALASLNLAGGTGFTNLFGGTMTLGGDVTNDGLMVLDGGGTASCGVDAIALRSTSAAQRAWNGAGNFRVVDANVQNQGGTAPIRVYSGTNAGNVGANWTFDTNCAPPTSAIVTIGGRVVGAGGRGISKVTVALIDASGNARYATTNPFGFYRFTNVAVGQSVTVTVNHKIERFAVPTRVLNVSEELTGVDFAALER